MACVCVCVLMQFYIILNIRILVTWASWQETRSLNIRASHPVMWTVCGVWYCQNVWRGCKTGMAEIKLTIISADDFRIFPKLFPMVFVRSRVFYKAMLKSKVTNFSSVLWSELRVDSFVNLCFSVQYCVFGVDTGKWYKGFFFNRKQSTALSLVCEHWTEFCQLDLLCVREATRLLLNFRRVCNKKKIQSWVTLERSQNGTYLCL